jgi:hypothetical protein
MAKANQICKYFLQILQFVLVGKADEIKTLRKYGKVIEVEKGWPKERTLITRTTGILRQKIKTTFFLTKYYYNSHKRPLLNYFKSGLELIAIPKLYIQITQKT